MSLSHSEEVVCVLESVFAGPGFSEVNNYSQDRMDICRQPDARSADFMSLVGHFTPKPDLGCHINIRGDMHDHVWRFSSMFNQPES